MHAHYNAPRRGTYKKIDVIVYRETLRFTISTLGAPLTQRTKEQQCAKLNKFHCICCGIKDIKSQYNSS